MAQILIVEDEERIASFVAKGLRAEGHQPTVATDGPSGLDEAMSGRPAWTASRCSTTSGPRAAGCP